MIKLTPFFLLPACLLSLPSCGPSTGSYYSSYYSPVYSVYQRPLVVDYDDYHRHGDHHHHHDNDEDRRNHYHPNNQWDRIAYDTANKNLSHQDIQNLNKLGSSSTKKKKK